MDVVSANKRLLGGTRNRGHFDLDAVMVESEVVSQDVVSLLKHSLLLAVTVGIKRDVTTEGVFIVRKGPHVDVVHL